MYKHDKYRNCMVWDGVASTNGNKHKGNDTSPMNKEIFNKTSAKNSKCE